MRFGPKATDEQIDEHVCFGMAFGMGHRMWLSLQAVEGGDLHAIENRPQTFILESLGLIALSGEFWALTPRGTTLILRRRYVARKGWTKRDADKLAGLTDSELNA